MGAADERESIFVMLLGIGFGIWDLGFGFGLAIKGGEWRLLDYI